MNAPVSAEERRDEKGVLFLDTTIFVVSLCIVALGVLLSYILEQRHHTMKKQEN
jgi:hypothetical protein